MVVIIIHYIIQLLLLWTICAALGLIILTFGHITPFVKSLTYFMLISSRLVLHTVRNYKSHLYTVYSLGADEEGLLIFLLPKFPFHRTESFKTTMADIAGRLVV